MKGFKVYQIDNSTGPVLACGRRDLCVIFLLTGPHQVSGADQEIEREGTCLFFGNPPGLHTSEGVLTHQMGYACRFTEEFVREGGPAGTQMLCSLLHGNQASAFWLREEQAVYLTGLFQLMLAEQQTAYRFKHELVRSYLQLIFHEALRLRTPAPKRGFRYYFRLPEPTGSLCTGWRRRKCR
jgi:AraC family transcriptional activator of pobA